MRNIKTGVLFLCILVIIHFSDFNPIWLWPWYRQTVGVWLFQNPGYGLEIFFVAMIVGLLIAGPEKKRYL